MPRYILGTVAALVAGATLGLADPPPSLRATPAPPPRSPGVMPTELPPLPGPVVLEHGPPQILEMTPPGRWLYGPSAPAEQVENGGVAPFSLWVSGDALAWWYRPAAGADDGPALGGRFLTGVALPGQCLGLEASGFFLQNEEGASQTTDLRSSIDLWGAEANALANLLSRPALGLDLLAGFRHVGLEEEAAAAEAVRTRNYFYGGQLGSQVEVRWRRLSTHVIGKAAFGTMWESADARSQAPAPTAGAASTASGAATAASSARQKGEEFLVIPELNVNVGYQVTPAVRLFAGYSFLYLSDVVRPGDVIASPVAVPSPSPGSVFSRGDVWAQGVSIGLALRY